MSNFTCDLGLSLSVCVLQSSRTFFVIYYTLNGLKQSIINEIGIKWNFVPNMECAYLLRGKCLNNSKLKNKLIYSMSFTQTNFSRCHVVKITPVTSLLLRFLSASGWRPSTFRPRTTSKWLHFPRTPCLFLSVCFPFSVIHVWRKTVFFWRFWISKLTEQIFTFASLSGSRF